MYKIILFITILTSINLLAYSDYDMDGVQDKSDKCPNTPLMDLADTSGCSIKSLENPHNFNILVGGSFSQTSDEINETTNTSTANLQVAYYYKDFSLVATTSYFDSNSVTYSNGGVNDSFLGAYYNLDTLDMLSISFGLGIIIPTYASDTNNNNLDYTTSVNLSYMLNSFNVFGGYSFTIVNDDDILLATYQNTNSYSAGVGFNQNESIYVSASYNVSESAYVGSEAIQTVSVYTNYRINENYFTTLSYAYGLSDTASDHYGSLKLGYNF